MTIKALLSAAAAAATLTACGGGGGGGGVTSTQTNLLTSFSINALNSLSVGYAATERVNDSAVANDPASALRRVVTQL